MKEITTAVTTIIKNKILIIYILLVIQPLDSNGQFLLNYNDYLEVDTCNIFDHSLYYHLYPYKKEALEYFEIGYMGALDSISILSENEILFHGIVDFSSKYECSGKLITSYKKSSEYTLFYVFFHKNKEFLFFEVNKKYDSVLIFEYHEHNVRKKRNYMIYLYKGKQNFY